MMRGTAAEVCWREAGEYPTNPGQFCGGTTVLAGKFRGCLAEVSLRGAR